MAAMNPGEPPEIRKGTLAPARVLFALVMREMTTRFGRSSAGYLWALIEPAAFIALLSLNLPKSQAKLVIVLGTLTLIALFWGEALTRNYLQLLHT